MERGGRLPGAGGAGTYTLSASTTGTVSAGISFTNFVGPAYVNQSSLAAGTAASTVPASGNTVGAILYQSAVNTTSGLAAVAAGSVLTSAGANTAPTYTTRSSITDIGAANNLSLTDPTGTFTGQIATTCLAITSAPTGTLTLGNILSGTGVTAGTRISQFGYSATANTTGATISSISTTATSFTVTHSAFPLPIPVGSFVQITGVTPDNVFCVGNQTVGSNYGLWQVAAGGSATTTVKIGRAHV